MNNDFKITIKKDSGQVELTLNDCVHDMFMDPLKERWEIPILQGIKETRPGQTYYCFTLSIEDANLFATALLHIYTVESGYNTNN